MLKSMNVNAKLLNPNLSDSEVNQNVNLSLDAIFNFANTKDQTSMSERIAFFNRYYWDQYSEEEYVLKYETITSLINEIINNLETDPKSLIGKNLAEQWSKIFPTTMTEKEMAEFKDSMALYSKLLDDEMVENYLSQNIRAIPTIPKEVSEWIGKALFSNIYKMDNSTFLKRSLESNLDFSLPNMSKEERAKYLQLIDQFIEMEPAEYISCEPNAKNSSKQFGEFVSEYNWSNKNIPQDSLLLRKKTLNLLVEKISKNLSLDQNSEEAKSIFEEYNKWQSNSICENPWLSEMEAMIAYKKTLRENTVDEFLAQNNRPNISDKVTKWLMIMNTNAMKEINLSK
jgi:hypothetical protein